MSKPSIVFAHGIWADGTCFQKLIPALRAEGHGVIAVQYGLDTLKGDVDATIRSMGRVSGPIVLVGHSYGGTVITHAGMDPRVAALVYIAALGPDETETSQGQQDKFPKTDVFKQIEVADGRVWMKPDGVPCFAGDLSPEEQGVVYATHFAPALDLFNQKQNLTLDGKKALKTLLSANKRLNTAYVLKESFGQLWSYEREGWARRFFENWRASLKWQRLKPYEKFAEMIDRHWDGIAAYCRLENKVSLGFVEGLNNKIRVIQRRAYGLRNEDYLRLKILTCMLPEL